MIRSTFFLRALLATIASAAESPPLAEKLQQKGYNVLFIGIDDLNDWVGCFGGKVIGRFSTSRAMGSERRKNHPTPTSCSSISPMTLEKKQSRQ